MVEFLLEMWNDEVKLIKITHVAGTRPGYGAIYNLGSTTEKRVCSVVGKVLSERGDTSITLPDQQRIPSYRRDNI